MSGTLMMPNEHDTEVVAPETIVGQVQSLLNRTDAFQHLPETDREQIRGDLTRVMAFLTDPAAGQPEVAEALAQQKEKTGAEKTMDRLAKKQDLVGKDFVAGGLQAGTQAFKEMVSSVDFPKFVSGLIEGVFTSIVDSSIRQMQAYGKLLEAVVKSVDQYANDHVSQNQARDYVAGKFPTTFKVNIENRQPKLAVRDDAPDGAAESAMKQLGLTSEVDLDDEEGEQKLLRQGQLEMARMRQQQLATMVLLGINRIVVTDGLINAKVLFSMTASDTATRTNVASMYDDKDYKSQYSDSGGWFSGESFNSQYAHKTVVQSATDDTSESKANIKANLSGEVRVNFKSETFPLEKMASVTQLGAVNERAQK